MQSLLISFPHRLFFQIFILLVITCSSPYSSLAQSDKNKNRQKDIIGTWMWSNENLFGEVLINTSEYYIDVSRKGDYKSISKALFNYKISNDTIYFYKWSKTNDQLELDSKYFIKSIENQFMELVDPNGERDRYYKTSNDIPIIPKPID